METDLINEYQKQAAGIIARNKSILDILTKLQCANARVARSVVKAVTNCGCVEIHGRKNFPEDGKNQLSGELCDECGSTVMAEIGEAMFYTASLCNTLGLSMSDILRRDLCRSDMMGKYSLR